MRVAVVFGCLGATAVQAQNLKVDSLRVELSWPADQVDDSVKAAFSRAGLTITRTTPSLIEAKESGTAGMGGGQIQRVVRASIYSGERISSQFDSCPFWWPQAAGARACSSRERKGPESFSKTGL